MSSFAEQRQKRDLRPPACHERSPASRRTPLATALLVLFLGHRVHTAAQRAHTHEPLACAATPTLSPGEPEHALRTASVAGPLHISAAAHSTHRATARAHSTPPTALARRAPALLDFGPPPPAPLEAHGHRATHRRSGRGGPGGAADPAGEPFERVPVRSFALERRAHNGHLTTGRICCPIRAALRPSHRASRSAARGAAPVRRRGDAQRAEHRHGHGTGHACSAWHCSMMLRTAQSASKNRRVTLLPTGFGCH